MLQSRCCGQKRKHPRAKMEPNIVVLGSCNIDMTVLLERFPLPGETLQGEAIECYPGGKGANQAVAAARLGVRTTFLGKLGQDTWTDFLLRSLINEHINTQYIKIEQNVPCGMAIIYVLKHTGENSIVYLPGANQYVDTAYVETVLPVLLTADVLLLQLEIPLTTVAHLLSVLPPKRPLVILDPAPVKNLSSLPLHRIDILTPNQQELQLITGCSDAVKAAESLLRQGVKHVICKLGEKGALSVTPQETKHFPSFPVVAVDTTAAGDAFNAALAVGLLNGWPLEQTITFANAAGALTVSRRGAQTSLPYKWEVDALLQQ
jgi:ribokinase